MTETMVQKMNPGRAFLQIEKKQFEKKMLGYRLSLTFWWLNCSLGGLIVYLSTRCE